MNGGKKPTRDQLEHRMAELAQTARRAAQITEITPDALVVVDETGIIVFANRRVHDLFGHRRSELLGQPLDSLLPEHYREGHKRHLRHYFTRPRARSMGTGLDLWARRADGSEFPVEISLSPFHLGDRILVASSIRDASERREIECRLREARARAEAATAEKTRFIAAASHDLRQPLQAAAIYLDLLTDESLASDRRADAARKAKECIDSLRALLNKVLHISKLDAGVVTARPTDFRVQTLLARLAAQFQPLARDKGLELRFRPSRSWAHSDPILTGQILENFVSNAIRYTDSGSVLVGCRRRGGRLRLQVWDTGAGIAEHERDKIFRAFYRAGNSRQAEPSDGSGLGLAIVGRLGSLLDHPIEVRSRPGKGSLFELVVPPAEKGRIERVVPRRREPRTDWAFLAVIDDNPAIADALSTVLRVAGHRVVSATTTADLLAELRGAQDPPDVVVTDFRLTAERTGLEALEAVRREYADAIPAIVLTGDSSFETLKHKSERGGFRVLAKPVDTTELLAEIESCLQESRQNRQARGDKTRCPRRLTGC